MGNTIPKNDTPSESKRTEVVNVIEPCSGWGSLELKALWEYRETLYFMVKQNIQAQYRQTALGPLWVLLQPLVQMLIYTLVFGKLAKLPSEGIPYPIFTYTALLPWLFFHKTLMGTANSLYIGKSVISKIYFPRFILPLSAMLNALVDFVAAFSILIILMLIYQVPPTTNILYLPLFILFAGASGVAFGLWLAGPVARFHDVASTLGYAMTAWQFMTPIAYSATLVPPRWLDIYRLNPMTGVVEGCRWALLGAGSRPDWTLLASSGLVLIVLVSGALLFARAQRNVVDIV